MIGIMVKQKFGPITNLVLANPSFIRYCSIASFKVISVFKENQFILKKTGLDNNGLLSHGIFYSKRNRVIP